MTQQSAKPSSINTSARCTHRLPNGTRCRLHITDADSRFCPAHASLPENQCEPADTAAALTANFTEFTSAAHINDFLTRLLLLLAQNRFSPRKAAVLAYITNQLLRTVSAINEEQDREGQTIIFDAPRPDRSALAGDVQISPPPTEFAAPSALTAPHTQSRESTSSFVEWARTRT